MTSISERAMPRQTSGSRNKKPDYFVRAQVGPKQTDYVPVGVAWDRTNGPGLSIRIQTLPFPLEKWTGVLKVLPPYEAEADAPDDND